MWILYNWGFNCKFCVLSYDLCCNMFNWCYNNCIDPWMWMELSRNENVKLKLSFCFCLSKTLECYREHSSISCVFESLIFWKTQEHSSSSWNTRVFWEIFKRSKNTKNTRVFNESTRVFLWVFNEFLENWINTRVGSRTLEYSGKSPRTLEYSIFYSSKMIRHEKITFLILTQFNDKLLGII